MTESKNQGLTRAVRCERKRAEGRRRNQSGWKKGEGEEGQMSKVKGEG